MDEHTKRAALFEYFKRVNNPKWVSNGDRLFKTLYDLKGAQLDSMYARMLKLQVREQAAKKAKEYSVYKRWKIPFVMMFFLGGMGIHFALMDKPEIIPSLMYIFVAGAWFEELMSNSAHNYIEYKRRKKNENS
jgi:phage terminase large subunit